MKLLAVLVACVSVSVTYALPGRRDTAEDKRDRCTAIGVGPKAMADGSTVTTHNNDCQECDIRITHVPARDWPAHSKRPVFGDRVMYPRYLVDPQDNIYGPDYAVGTEDSSIADFDTSVAIMYIDQVPHTYGYTMGAYAIQNEKQVAMGESTCGSVFWATPSYAKGGKANFNMHALMEIALERCDTARCAILTMGGLATEYGFFGSGWDDSPESAKDEAGEAIPVSDKHETWMFHIAADDTGASAIWAAKRVPDDHITAVANQFTIGEIDINDSANYLASSNVFEVAIRNGIWSPTSGKPFHFTKAYSTDRKGESFACSRRVWRVLTLAAPSLLPIFQPYTDGFSTFGFGQDGNEPYPFSVKPDRPLTVQDVMDITRDQYEGSVFDMTKGIDAGPFGDPMRYGPKFKWQDERDGVTWKQFDSGLGFQRPISLWRTSYATVTTSRKDLPDEIGAVAWIAPYAPHHSSFVPVYANAEATPKSLNKGTLYYFDQGSNWWIHCMASNYLSKWYSYTLHDIRALQRDIETTLFSRQPAVEAEAKKLLEAKTHHHLSASNAAKAFLGEYHESSAQMILDRWWSFFFAMVGKYRDMYMIDYPNTDNFLDAYTYLSVPRWYYEQIGYWGAPGTPPPGEAKAQPVLPFNVRSEPTQEAYKAKYPNGFYQPYDTTTCTPSAPAPVVAPAPIADAPVPAADATATHTVPDASYATNSGVSMGVVFFALFAGLVGGAVGTVFVMKTRVQSGYELIH